MKKGFTIIELLVVIAILGILGNVVYSVYNCSKKHCKDTEKTIRIEKDSFRKN